LFLAFFFFSSLPCLLFSNQTFPTPPVGQSSAQVQWGIRQKKNITPNNTRFIQAFFSLSTVTSSQTPLTFLCLARICFSLSLSLSPTSLLF